MTPEHFPPRLAQLGLQGSVIRGVEVILPPVCLVPAGPFLMGSDPERDPLAAQHFGARELPQHTVVLPAFEVARFPVTVAEYACSCALGAKNPLQLDWRLAYSTGIARPSRSQCLLA
jgi:formylglycine-generating enzyme required for sulfatase activity